MQSLKNHYKALMYVLLTCQYTSLISCVYSQVCIVDGDRLDLGSLSGAIELFLLVHFAIKAHVMATFNVLAHELDTLELTWKTPKTKHFKLNVTPGPLVDWRARTLPHYAMAGRKRKPVAKASERPGKRLKDSNGDQEAESEAQEMPMDMDDEEEEGQDSESELRTQ
jgi:hypothetical protein